MPVTHRPSPNFDQRATGRQIEYVILHYTGMQTAAAALDRLTSPAAKVSAHYLIDSDGKIVQLVAEDDRAWHAGESCWRGMHDMNSSSIGIELVNKGHEFGYHAFPARQIAAMRNLVTDIMRRHFIGPEGVLGHSDIAPQRKDDPGELFPWQELAAAGIGLWPEVTDEDAARAAAADLRTAQGFLRIIGYDVADDGLYDAQFRRVVLAFQRHWHPASLTGTLEHETVTRMAALARIVPAPRLRA